MHFRTQIRVHFSKSGAEDPDPLLWKGRSEDLDQFFPNVDSRIWIRIHVKMRWIRNGEQSKRELELLASMAHTYISHNMNSMKYQFKRKDRTMEVFR